MNLLPEWLPAICEFSDYQGNWNAYITAVYEIFRHDFIVSRPQLRRLPVSVRHQPFDDGKEFTFWHCVSEGDVEHDRMPDLRRCERVPWLRPIIEHESDRQISTWVLRKQRDSRLYLWLDESYLVVLGQRNNHFLLITAFPTDREHTRRKLRRERDEARSLNG